VGKQEQGTVQEGSNGSQQSQSNCHPDPKAHRELARPTACTAGYPASSSASPLMLRYAASACSATIAAASAARSDGPKPLAGVLIRSRAK
jgi:hypothetical protein